MRVLKNIYRRLNLLQQRLYFQIAATVVALALCGGVFGSLLYANYDIATQYTTLVNALRDQNVNEGDVHAVSLQQNGTVTIDGRTYGGERIQRLSSRLFDDEGNVLAPLAARGLLADQYPSYAPRWMIERPETTRLLAVVCTMLILLVIWIGLTFPFLITTFVTALLGLSTFALGATQATVAIVGIGILTFAAVLLMRALLVLFQYPNQILAVAHTVVKETTRSRISLVFIVLLLVILPLLPLWLDPESPLRFRIQSFISYSLGLTFGIAACMTLFLSCATVAFEIRDRQIWQLVTKPLHRFNYLLGKWLGVMSVNVVLLIVAGLSTFMFIQYLRYQPVAPGREGQLDRMQVESQILTARRETQANYRGLSEEQLSQRVRQIIENDPEYASADEVPLAIRRQLRSQIQRQYQRAQRTIPAERGQQYEFTGLADISGGGRPLTLYYRFFILDSSEHDQFPAVFEFNEDRDTRVQVQYVPTLKHDLSVPADYVRADGSLTVTIYNAYRGPTPETGSTSLHFEADELTLMYSVGTFELNFLRGMLMMWTKLAFLSMLGIFSATFLSFPVACLLSFTVFIAGLMSPFLAISVQWYPVTSASQVDWSNIIQIVQWLFKSTVRALAQLLVFALHGFGEISPRQHLIEGRYLPWSAVIIGFFRLDVLWSGAALLLGWAVIRFRQLAIYSGHG